MNTVPSVPTAPGLALITGGGRGIGRATALYLARAGWDVLVTYQSRADAAQATVAEIREHGRRAVALPLDTGDVAQFAGFVAGLRTVLSQEFGRTGLDVLVNNAGHGVAASFLETSEAQFDRLMDVHLKGVFFLTQALVPLLADGGRIVNVSSGLARFSFPGRVAYAVMKGGVEVLTRYLAQELGPRGIRVNTIAPGAVVTDFGGGRLRSDPGLQAAIGAQAALGKPGEADEIGSAIAALVSPALAWVTGQRIEASGGMLL